MCYVQYNYLFINFGIFFVVYVSIQLHSSFIPREEDSVYMTDHTDKGFQLGNFVFDVNNQERQSWKCFGQTCNRSLVVFVSQFFVILLVLACCIVRITLAGTSEETTVWIAILSSTVGYILPSPKL